MEKNKWAKKSEDWLKCEIPRTWICQNNYLEMKKKTRQQQQISTKAWTNSSESSY